MRNYGGDKDKLRSLLDNIVNHYANVHGVNHYANVHDGWLVGWLGFTALQKFIGYIAPVSVVNVRMSARAGLVGVVPTFSWKIVIK